MAVRHKHKSIRYRFLKDLSVILFISTVVLSTVIAVNEGRMLNRSLITKGRSFASYIAKLSKDPLIMKDSIQLDSIVSDASKDEDILYAVIDDANGSLTTSQFASINYRSPRLKAILKGLPKESELQDIIYAIRKRGAATEVSMPIFSGPYKIGEVTICLSQYAIHRQILNTVLFILVLNIAVAFILGYVVFSVSRQVLFKPLAELAGATDRLAKGDLTSRITLQAADELQVLFDNFNRMAEDLDKSTVSKAYMDNIIEGMINTFIVADHEDKIIRANAATCSLLDYREDELKGKPINTILAGNEAANYFQIKTLPVEKRINMLEGSYRAKGGQMIPVLLSVSALYDEKNVHQSTVYIAQDFTERKKTEELIKQNEIFIKSILESVDEGFVVVGKDYRIISANRAFCDKAGMTIEDAIGRYCHEVYQRRTTPCFEAGVQCSVKHTLETGEHAAFMHTHCDEHGLPMYVDTKSYAMRDATGNVTSVIEICVDVTEKKKLEDQYRHAQKMEAIGQLAGGVAHDFNNILSAIIGYGHLSQMKLRDDDPVRHYIDQILQSSERAAALTQSLLAFSRKQPAKKELQELNSVIRNFEKFLHRLLREDIEMTTRYSIERPVIMADRGQVEQVIMNLVTNARDAIPDRGKLTIDTKVSAMDEAFLRAHGYGKVGDYAMLSVSDTGVGMNKETKKRIFEPFFTTKEMGKGTGLGLAIVYGIVKAHDGFINVYSEPEKGTTFHVYFPVVRTTNAVPELAEQIPVPLKGGNETIFLAEDDASLRNMTSVVLRGMGYTVIEAEDGDRAVVRFGENRAAIKLVILDGIMPKMNGLEAYQKISALNPNIRCIFMSGYSGEVFAQNGLPNGTEFLPKPVKPSELLSKVREMLDRE